MKKKSKKKSQKILKNPIKNKLLPRVKEVVMGYLDNGANASQTAKQFKVDIKTLLKLLATDEAKTEIKRMDDDTYLLHKRIKRKLALEGLNSFLQTKKHKEKKDWAYFLANLTGSTSDVRIAKIQSGRGQGSTESNGGQMTTEDLEHYRQVTKNDKK